MRKRWKEYGREAVVAVHVPLRHRRRARFAALFPIALLPVLNGCAGSTSVSPGLGAQPDTYDRKWGVSSSERVISVGPVPKGGGHYKLGRPYQVGGRWYVPRHEPYYDRMGVGSWYGTDFHGRKTANGEIFDMDALTAAHPTLPLPSYAYVTNMRNGRTILVRINDRGPYVADREIDLSRASARVLGYAEGGLGRVRVRWAGHAPMSGDDRREQVFLRSQPWYTGSDRIASPRFDQPAPAQRYEPRPQRYAQDSRNRTDAEVDQGDTGYAPQQDNPGRYGEARVERRAAQPEQVGWGQDDTDAAPPRQYRQPAEPSSRPPYASPQRRYAEPAQPQRSDYAEVPYAEGRSDEPAPPPAPVPEQQWSPFDHRESVNASKRR